MWYTEYRFLKTQLTARVSDTTEYFTFGCMFRTPSNPTHQEANQLLITFSHQELPWEQENTAGDPPQDIAQIVKRTLTHPRCVIDGTRHRPLLDEMLSRFRANGYTCEANMVDQILCKQVANSCSYPEIKRLSRSDLDQLIVCNARSFGYDRSNDTLWLHEKLGRQISNPREFRVYGRYMDQRIVSFAVVFVPSKCSQLAYVQVVGTDPGYRRQGHARRVLEHALGQLPLGADVYLEAVEEGPIAMYRQAGFQRAGEIVSAECYL